MTIKKKPETRGRKQLPPEKKKVAVTFFIPQINAEAFRNDASRLLKKYL
jgi:hypothetical protein